MNLAITYNLSTMNNGKVNSVFRICELFIVIFFLLSFTAFFLEKLMLLQEQLLAEQEKVKSIENEFQVETKTFKEQYKALQNKHDHDIIQIRQEMNDQCKY